MNANKPTEKRNDNPIRDYDFYELQQAGETRWHKVKSWNDGETLEQVQKLAAAFIKENNEYNKNLRVFIDLGSDGPYRLVHVIKHCENVLLK